MKTSNFKRLINFMLLVIFWLYVSIPLAWGIWSSIRKALALFS